MVSILDLRLAKVSYQICGALSGSMLRSGKRGYGYVGKIRYGPNGMTNLEKKIGHGYCLVYKYNIT